MHRFDEAYDPSVTQSSVSKPSSSHPSINSNQIIFEVENEDDDESEFTARKR